MVASVFNIGFYVVIITGTRGSRLFCESSLENTNTAYSFSLPSGELL